jgi:hypothetical protein
MTTGFVLLQSQMNFVILLAAILVTNAAVFLSIQDLLCGSINN